MERSKIARKAHLLLNQYGIGVNEPDYSFLMDNIIAAREQQDWSWKRITKWLEDTLN
jgi:hypothetical protein